MQVTIKKCAECGKKCAHYKVEGGVWVCSNCGATS